MSILLRFVKIAAQKVHKGAHLALGALCDIFGRKNVDGYRLDADIPAVGGHPSERFCPRAVAEFTDHPALFRPSAVSVHYKGDMRESFVHRAAGSMIFFV